MRIEPLGPRHSIKALATRYMEEMTAAGYPAAWARQLVSDVRSGAAPALVALTDGKASGLLAWKMRQQRALISLIAVCQPDPRPALAALLARALPALAAQGAARVVYQMRQAAPALYREGFIAAGFAELQVEKMVLTPPAAAERPTLPAGYRLVPWRPEYAESVAYLFQALERHPLERWIWPHLATPAGARELVDMLTQGDAIGSFVIVDERAGAGTLAGYVLAQRLRSGEGHIGELGVEPGHARRGLGRALVQAAVEALADAPTIWLTVSAGNSAARALYQKLGFERTETQSVFVWTVADGRLEESEESAFTETSH
jgi:ribosomal protein S18 acetylase RimI-like enzyme